MLILLLIFALLSAGAVMTVSSRRFISLPAMCYFVVQCGVALSTVFLEGESSMRFFTFDTLGVTYFVLMSLLGILCAWRSQSYLNDESLRQLRIYYTSLIALSIALTGVYMSNNITVTWIFLEATTIATAGLTYHRRTVRSLEATWKYIFVSSVGIAVAYLGILMLSTVSHAHAEANLSYHFLNQAVAGGNSLYLKLAFLFILVGYTTKMELFPLFTVGVDANHAAPAPASAFISTAMVGGGFVAIYRVYGVMSGNEQVFLWVKNVMLVVGVLSLLVAAVYMGRTQNYKRLFAYSTVENGGLIALGLGIGGLGVYAALLHALVHTVIKGVVFLQLSVVGKMYGNYKIGKIGDYFAVDKMGSLVLMLGFVGLIAMPPSLLFRSEYIMLTELVAGRVWWLIFPVTLTLATIIYWLCAKVLPVFYKQTDKTKLNIHAKDRTFSIVLMILLLAVFTCGMVNFEPLMELVRKLATLH